MRVRLEKRRQCGPRVVGVPLCLTRTHQIAVGLINGESGYQRKVQLNELTNGVAPHRRSRFGTLLPQIAGFTESPLLVRVVVVGRVVLNGPVLEHRLRQAVPMFHAVQPQAGAIQYIHVVDPILVMVAGSTDAKILSRFID